MNNDSLNVLLTEYQTLRSELNKVSDREIQIFTIIISALGISYGIIFSQNIYDLVIFVPILIYPLYRRFRYGRYAITLFNRYLIIIEDQIKKLTKNKDWIGWEHFWEDKKEEKERQKFIKTYTISSRLFLFILIPVGISLLFSLFICISYIFNYNSIINFTRLHPLIHFILIIIYAYILFRALLLYYNKEPKGLIYLIKEFSI